MSRQSNAQAQTAAQQRGRAIWGRLAVLVFLLPAAAVLLPTTLVLCAVLLPTLAAYIVDRVPGRALTVTVGLLNVTGALPAVVMLWTNGHTLAAAQWVLGKPVAWLIPYMAAGLAWLIFLGLPPLLRRYYAHATQSRIKTLEQRQQELIDLWGREVAGVHAKANADETDGDADDGADGGSGAAASGR